MMAGTTSVAPTSAPLVLSWTPSSRKFRGVLETSAKKNLGCEELKRAILDGINWDEIPCRTTEVLFKRLKEEIIRLKDEGRVLMRFNELRETLQLRLSGEFKRFADEELRAVLTLLATTLRWIADGGFQISNRCSSRSASTPTRRP